MKRKSNFESPLSSTVEQSVIHRAGGRCELCKTKYDLSIHHIIPRSEGGSDCEDNLMALCYRCHDKVEISGYRVRQLIILCCADSCDENYNDYYDSLSGLQVGRAKIDNTPRFDIEQNAVSKQVKNFSPGQLKGAEKRFKLSRDAQDISCKYKNLPGSRIEYRKLGECEPDEVVWHAPVYGCTRPSK